MSESTIEPNDGSVIDLQIEQDLKDSYLTYAMSTIMDRALPDVRDGLKPSQRRILVAMNDLNLRPGRKHLKCAKIAGDTSGNYHPHGEGVIYPTLVGMAQRWRMRVPLVDPQGNFGSIEGDPPAAMRYTEARMTQAALDMMADLKLDTVDFQANYDERLTEPTVLPGKFPNLLINGSMGIAVGMACSLPPHNPTEVFDAITRVIDDPDIEIMDLMTDEVDEEGNVTRQGIKGPDFPTGGVIEGRLGIVEGYTTGRGRVSIRGTCHVEELTKDREQIVIDEIPYNLSQNGLVERIVEAVKEERVTDVSDVRNESGRQARTRVVIELKRGADPRVVENQLCQFTPLRQTFSIMNIALTKRRPRTLTLKEIIELYIEHREDVIKRRTAHLLREAKKKKHIQMGLVFAVCDIDEVIKLIRTSQTREEAINRLREHKFFIPQDHPVIAELEKAPKLHAEMVTPGEPRLLTQVQADAIGSMRLIQLVGLEFHKLVDELRDLQTAIEEYESILADRLRVMTMIKEDCDEMRERYNAPRLTQIEESASDIDIESLIQEHTVAVTISRQGYAKRVPLDTYRLQGRGGKGIRGGDAKDGDFVEHLFVASTHDDLLCFTDTGRVFRMKVYELPEMSRTSKGRAIVNLIDLKPGERTCAFLTIKDFEAHSHSLTFVSEAGIVKRTPLKAYRNVHRGGLIAVGLKEGDALMSVSLTSGTDDLLLVTADGLAIRFNEENVREMGRSAAGVRGIALQGDNEVVGAVQIPMNEDGTTANPELNLLTITEFGYGKQTPVDEYRVHSEDGTSRSQSRGGKGRADIKINARNGRATAALGVNPGDHLVAMTIGGQLVRVPVDEISTLGRGTQGVRVVRVNEGDRVVAVARVPEDADPEQVSEQEDAGEESES